MADKPVFPSPATQVTAMPAISRPRIRKATVTGSLVCSLAYLLTACNHTTLAPFASDGCSSFPDGTFAQSELWLQCCVAHDLAYWQGGTYTQRLQADRELKACVAQVGQAEIANLMLAGVRVGGTPFLPTSFRWGYGWKYPRFYGEPTAREQSQIKALMPESQ